MSWAGVLAVLAMAFAIATPRFEDDRGEAAQVTRVLDCRPGDIAAIAVEREGVTTRLARDGTAWSLVESDGSAWPADPGIAAGIVRTLAAAEGAIASDEAWDAGAVLSIDLADGTRRSIEIADRVIAGNTRVRTGGRTLRVAADWYRVFVATRPTAWRSARVVPAAGGSLRRVGLISQGGEVGLARGPRGWTVDVPVVTPADPPAVEALLAVLSGLEFEGASAAPEGEALASIVATERVIATGDERVWTVGLYGAADLEGRVVARVTSERHGQTEFATQGVVSSEALSRLTLDPAAYVSRAALPGSAADVLAIVIGESEPRHRPLAGWDAATRTALDTLAEASASDVVVGRFEGDAEPAVLELLGLGDVPIATYSVLADDAGAEPAVWIGSGSVWRGYRGEAARALLGLMDGPAD